MKVLIGVTYCGEAEFDACLHSIERQIGLEISVFVIKNLGNKEAHDALYAEFMANAGSVDCFLHLGADMAFQANDSLLSLCGYLVDASVGSVFAYVDDIPSGLKIPGIRLLRSSARWGGSADRLMVDYPPSLIGETKIIINGGFVSHMSASSNYQLFRYGIHKALKSLQEGSAKKNAGKAVLHSTILCALARNYFLGNKSLAWSLIGATLIYTGRLRGVEYESGVTREFFASVAVNPEKLQVLVAEAESFWCSEVQSWLRWVHRFQPG